MEIRGYTCRIWHSTQSAICLRCNSLEHLTGDILNCPAYLLSTKQNLKLPFEHPKNPLTNYWDVEICMENLKFKSSEHAYLYFMCIELGEPELAECVRDAATAAIAKQRSRDIPLSTDRTEWNKIKLNVMKSVLCAMANSSPSFVQYLLKTGDKFLAEATRDTFWGAGLSPHMCRTTDPSHYPGSNHLGMMLMELRMEIIKEQSSQKSSIRLSPSPPRHVSSSDVTSPPPQTQEIPAPQPLSSQSPAAVVPE